MLKSFSFSPPPSTPCLFSKFIRDLCWPDRDHGVSRQLSISLR
jgi:hypothetical protein